MLLLGLPFLTRYHTLPDSDSEDDPHESSNMAVAMKRKMSINQRALSATLHGMVRSYHVQARTMATGPRSMRNESRESEISKPNESRSAVEDLTKNFWNIA
jgi:hypothetical protein